jgi:hypothetical protein
MEKVKMTLIGLSVAMVTGCSSTYDAGEHHAELQQKKYELEVEQREEALESIPDWFLEPLRSNDSGFYAVGNGKAKSLHTAIRKAELRAQVGLAGNVSQLITAQEKMFNKSSLAGDGENIQSAIESFINEQDVAGTVYDRKEVALVGNEYVVYVRAFLPVKEIQAAKEAAEFARDLNLASETAQLELMNRVAAAKKQAQKEKELEAAKTQAEADKKAAALVQQQLAQ